MKNYLLFCLYLVIAPSVLAQSDEKCKLNLPSPERIDDHYTDIYSAFQSIFPSKLLKKNRVETVQVFTQNDSLYQSFEVNKKGFVKAIQKGNSHYFIHRNRKQRITKYQILNTENADTTIFRFDYTKRKERRTREYFSKDFRSVISLEKTFSKQGFIQSYVEYFSADTSVYIVSFDTEKKALNLRDIDEFWNETTIYDTRYFYDSKNRVTKFLDYENNKFYGKTTYHYNSKGQLTKLTDSYIDDLKDMSGDSGTVNVGDSHYYETTFEYNKNGLLTTIWFKNGEPVCEYKVVYN